MNGKISGTAINICTKYIIKKVQCPVACAKSLSEELLIKDKIKVEYIRNGVIPFKNLVGEKMDFKKRLKLDTNYRYFVSVGRLSPEKNISTLIEAFKEANPVGFKLIIIGDGQLMESLRKIANENIIFTGFISNIGDYLAASDFYITTSLTEGMALSTIYGMASGLPLLLSDIPPHEEIFDLAEGNPIGSLFNNNTIVDAIRKMALCPTYNKLSANIIDIYKNNFTADKMSTSYQRFYESALKA
jgi:glycosyltransferase involved in cell wall biosynthesis